jgi:hypothetical protein
MCERFIGELAQECQQFKNDKATPAASGRSAIHHSPSSSSSNPNTQLQVAALKIKYFFNEFSYSCEYFLLHFIFIFYTL